MADESLCPNYEAMAELRYQIRRFLRFSENAARQAGIEPQQYQLLMAVKGLPAHAKPNIRALAERMQLQHHSTVELIDRLVERGLLSRLRATDDRRQVLVKLTRDGEEFIENLALHHLQEWQSAGPTLVKLLQAVIENAQGSASTEKFSKPSETKALSKQRKDRSHG
jgi:DNA-binding MarR family transcriptional regulator